MRLTGYMKQARHIKYTKRERNAEHEIDAFLQQVRGGDQLSVLEDLRRLSGQQPF